MNNKVNFDFFPLLLSLITILTILFSYVRYVHFKDFYVEMRVTCNSQAESCFYDDSLLSEGGQVFNYKLINTYAKNVPECNGWAGLCTELTCDGSDLCSYTNCTSDNVFEISRNSNCAI